MKGVQLRRRMLWSLKIQARCFGVRRCLGRSKDLGDNHQRRMERHVRNGQHIRCLRGNHPLAAIMTLIGRIAGHETAALHTLLVLGHRGQAVRKLHAQQGDHRHDDKQSLAHCPKSTLGGLDARVNERIRVTCPFGRGGVGFVIAGALLVYLLRPEVRAAFTSGD